jgi:hypothetical protein
MSCHQRPSQRHTSLIHISNSNTAASLTNPTVILTFLWCTPILTDEALETLPLEIVLIHGKFWFYTNQVDVVYVIVFSHISYQIISL